MKKTLLITGSVVLALIISLIAYGFYYIFSNPPVHSEIKPPAMFDNAVLSDRLYVPPNDLRISTSDDNYEQVIEELEIENPEDYVSIDE